MSNHLLFYRSRRVDVHEHGVAVLFQPIVTTSRCSLIECDFNGHKSNSTFYSDLDVNRIHLLGALFKEVISPQKRGSLNSKPAKKLNPALGGVSCTFHREIKPFEKYEIWSRVLTWDEKWIYIASYFVKTGAVQPKGYSLQPSSGEVANGRFERGLRDGGKDIFASAISKYVFKQGRRTIPPEEVLLSLNLWPIQPELVPGKSSGLQSINETREKEDQAVGVERKRENREEKEDRTNSIEQPLDLKALQDEWRRGSEVASHFAKLDELKGVPILPFAYALGKFTQVGFD